MSPLRISDYDKRIHLLDDLYLKMDSDSKNPSNGIKDMNEEDTTPINIKALSYIIYLLKIICIIQAATLTLASMFLFTYFKSF